LIVTTPDPVFPKAKPHGQHVGVFKPVLEGWIKSQMMGQGGLARQADF